MIESQNFSSISSTVKTILVVDDMEANRAVLSRRLEKFGYGVVCVDSGEAALTILAQAVPDIILLDYMMPQMNGIELLHELRSNSATKEVPVIMVTARAEGDATIEALAAGADDYVTKPIDFEVLKARIDAQLAKCTDKSQLQRTNAALDERAALRSMVLADLEGELKEEIHRRKGVEAQLEAQENSRENSNAGQTEIDPEIARLIQVVSDKFDGIFACATSGKTLNLAQFAEVKGLLADLRGKT